MSGLDDVCKQILAALLKGQKAYSGVQREIGAGSLKTVKNHVKHLQDAKLVKVDKLRRGIRYFPEISLTEKGSEVARNVGQEE